MSPSTDPNEEVLDQIEDTEDEIDELAEELAVLSILNEERHKEILERVEKCNQTLTEKLSVAETTPPESPLLLQVLNELTAIKTDLTNLKSSQEQIQNQLQKNSQPPRTESDSTNQESQTEEPPDGPTEEPPPASEPEKKRKNTFV